MISQILSHVTSVRHPRLS